MEEFPVAQNQRIQPYDSPSKRSSQDHATRSLRTLKTNLAPSALPVSALGASEVSVANGSMCRGWGGEVDGHENATLNQYRETATGEADADEIEQGSPCLVRR
jgi:hypothetical protein